MGLTSAPCKPAAAPTKPTRPEWCPEKFWNADKGEVNSEAMAKSYTEVEKKIGTNSATTMPIARNSSMP